MNEEERIEQEELAKLETVPEPVRTNAKMFLKHKPKALPVAPEKGVWYVYRPKDCICSNGTPYYSTLKIGTENKLLVMFCGGGAAFNPHCAPRPNTYLPVEGKETYYVADTFVMGYFTGHNGVANKDKAENPFKDWSVAVVSYGSGDFHCGDNDFEYDDPELGKGVCHHRGYRSYRAMVEKIKEFVPAPDKILVTGYSAGGFGTALLTDDIMTLFDTSRDVTCMPDSAILKSEGFKTALAEQWIAPKAVREQVVTDNITLDCLLHLHRKYGERVKIALGCSYRDALLAQCQAFFDGAGMIFDEKYGDEFQNILRETVSLLREKIPNVALYIFDKPHPEIPNMNLTEHCFLSADFMFDYKQDGVSMIDWAYNAVEGKPQQVGLRLLGL